MEMLLQIDWEKVVPHQELSFIIGNPPFIGHQWRSEQQMIDMELVFGNARRCGRLDYVAAWYLKAAKMIQGTRIKVAFVSTNSIEQGEQVGILWSLLLTKYKIKIHFAHRTFSWSNEAKGKAAVHVVIIGFANFDCTIKKIYDYENIKGEPHEMVVKNINPYLTEGEDILVESRGKPIHNFAEMFKGSQPTDGGFLLFTEEEKESFLEKEPLSKNWIRSFMGGEELLNKKKRYCLWLKDCPPDLLKKMPFVLKRLEEVSKSRLQSSTKSVQEFAKFPSLFTQNRQPDFDYLAIPEVSSETRRYIPIGYLSKEVIASNKIYMVPGASLYLFGILMSSMHMTWTKTVCGRMKSDYSYSPSVYNNFSFPIEPNEKQVKSIETAGQNILDIRAKFFNSSLADLYDARSMPPELSKGASRVR